MKYPQLVSMPSAVSDWLEEQLEARGIDAVVYTRYVLSLLHRDPVDVICPDQDLHFTHPNKEVRRSGGSRKRFRHSAEWWRRDQADADKLKRSAAVECLMSASDQKCGIESLVDELCEKLKEINSKSTSIQDTNCNKSNINQKNQGGTAAQDSAKRYYAAFPPLSRASAGSPPQPPNSIITLIPKWLGSPKRKLNRKQNRSSSYEDKLHCKIETENMKARAGGKQRLAYLGRGKKELGYCRNVAKSMEHRTDNVSDWGLYMLTNNAKMKRTSNSWPQTITNQETAERCLEIGNLWESDDNMNMYDDLPVDIRELLDSPPPQDDTVEMMNLANMRDTGNKTFIQCGTNITSSIWTNDAIMDDINYDNIYNTAVDTKQAELLLDLKFSSISINNNRSKEHWPGSTDVNIIAENETNFFFETCTKSLLGGTSIPWDITASFNSKLLEKWSEDECCEDEMQLNIIARSFMKLNHNKEESSFIEVLPKTARGSYNIFNNASNVLRLSVMRDKVESDKDKDDLLTSVRSHFKPINEKVENRVQGHYVDGTTFVIPSNIETVNYKRSDSGAMYLETESGIKKKYSEYKIEENEKDKKNSFILKFNICENNKACQTDIVDECVEVVDKDEVQEDFYFPGDEQLFEDDESRCSCAQIKQKKNATIKEFDTVNCPVHLTRPDSMMAELMWKTDKQCDKCISWNNSWFSGGLGSSFWDKQSLYNIWNGGEVCLSCLGLNGGRPPPTQQQDRLREDVSQDGEQLLSDLSTIQKSYMEELPVTEISCDISELLGPKERKRRHSYIYEDMVQEHRGSWSFASRLEEDCLIQMSTIPTLRSVTL